MLFEVANRFNSWRRTTLLDLKINHTHLGVMLGEAPHPFKTQRGGEERPFFKRIDKGGHHKEALDWELFEGFFNDGEVTYMGRVKRPSKNSNIQRMGLEAGGSSEFGEFDPFESTDG